MAKYEKRGTGNFQQVLSSLHNEILSGSFSASFEEESNLGLNGTRVTVRAYERYSWLGKNRVSLTLTLVGFENRLNLTVITTGGSQAVFLKLNTWGESSFLNLLVNKIDELIK